MKHKSCFKSQMSPICITRSFSSHNLWKKLKLRIWITMNLWEEWPTSSKLYFISKPIIFNLCRSSSPLLVVIKMLIGGSNMLYVTGLKVVQKNGMLMIVQNFNFILIKITSWSGILEKYGFAFIQRQKLTLFHNHKNKSKRSFK